MKIIIAFVILSLTVFSFVFAQNAENGGLYFHIVDEEETQAFNDFYNKNPSSTFDDNGALINPHIVSPDVIILGLFDMGRQKNNAMGNPDFAALRTGIRLDKNEITDVRVEKHMMSGEPIVTFYLSPEGGELFFNHTLRNAGRLMAVVFENQIRFIARITSPIRDAVTIQGFEEEETNRIADLLRTVSPNDVN